MEKLIRSFWMVWTLLVLAASSLAASESPPDGPGLRTLMAQNPSMVVIDVRTPAEYKAGHIPGAVLLPFDTIDVTTAANTIPSKGTKVVVYCHSGRRAGIAMGSLARLGYTDLTNFGGIARWEGTLVSGSAPR